MTTENQLLREALLPKKDRAFLGQPFELLGLDDTATLSDYHSRVQALIQRIEALTQPAQPASQEQAQQPGGGEVVAWAVVGRDGSVHSTKTNRESAERCADRWRAKQAENGRDGWVCGVKPLTFATAPQPAPVAPDGFAIVPVEPTHEHAVWAAMLAASQQKGGQ